LIDCALEAFAAYGFEGATVRSIASSADVDPTLINYHFGSKLGLWRAVVDRIANQVEALVERFSQMGESSKMIDALVDEVCDNPNLAFFLIKEVSYRTDRFSYFFIALIAPLRDQMAPIIRQEINPDSPDNEKAELIHFLLMGAMVMAIVTRSFRSDSGEMNIDQRFKTDLQTLLRRLIA